VLVKPDRTYELEISTPKTTWLLHRAAGIRRDAQNPGEIAGKISVKHVYEIAKIKSQDKWYIGVPLKVNTTIIQSQQHISLAGTMPNGSQQGAGNRHSSAE